MKTIIQRIFALCACILFFNARNQAQDLTYVRSVLDSLCAPSFDGRGYVNHGERHAADFIVRELQKTNAVKLAGAWLQRFNININTFPGKMELTLDAKALVAGNNFMMGGASPGITGTYKTLWVNNQMLNDPKALKKFLKKDLSSTVLIIDTGFQNMKLEKLYTAKAMIIAEKGKPSYEIPEGQNLANTAYAIVSRESIPEGCASSTWNVVNEYKKNYQTQNVMAMIKGSSNPDSCIVFSAHYDHLGRMGSEVYFPGANDNASGTAMLLDLARYYSQDGRQPECSVVFLFFAAEEVGILGSEYFTKHPQIPLSKIKFLINLDMVSTGSEGIKVVNGGVLKKQFEILSNINTQNSLLKTVSPRGEAANSDHYWFYKNGVPSFFIYTLGNEWKEYHTPEDVPQGLPFTEYEDLFKLVTLFVNEIQ
jgi:hypothetical protein